MKIESFSVRTKPFPGESFWSFLLRLSSRNGIPILSLLNSLRTWENRYVQRADWGLLDFYPESIVDLPRLSQLSRRSVDELHSTSLYNLLKIFGVSEEVQRSRFLSGMLSDDYRFCPQCLSEKIPYYRLLWRLEAIAGCLAHRSRLLNECPNCHNPIRLRDVEHFNVCPYCGRTHSDSQTGRGEALDWDQQEWLYDAFKTLLASRDVRLEAPDVASRLLYVLGGCSETFSRENVEAALADSSTLPTLLQHARDSLSQKRTLHLSFLLQTLYGKGISMAEFLNVSIPQSFIESLKQDKVRKSEQLACLAPWCSGYHLPGTLVKTGTTLKRRKSGEVLFYYVACTECCCEYAVDDHGNLKERTYFIEGYRAFIQDGIPTAGIKEMARQIGMTEDKIRRCLAYFSIRQVMRSQDGGHANVDPSLLQNVLRSVRTGVPLKAIQTWECWDSYQQFLLYRFHPDVMRALIELKRPRPSKRIDAAANREEVREALESLLQRDQDVTISAVCEIVGVCPETIRNWGCNHYIAEMKERQKNIRSARMQHELYEKTDEYLAQRPTEKVAASELYKHLGVLRTVLWRSAPEITAYVMERLRRHNQGVSEQELGPV
ncbi:TniQ family protein [Alicyclobacillus suci]|uniref:TniQ family protein n=1 Tax=Alicyclobacillus suci TaxID=2816080 RepID=UPI001A8F01D4|nr:TniQ family protein [Alicyclobacillus suci]